MAMFLDTNIESCFEGSWLRLGKIHSNLQNPFLQDSQKKNSWQNPFWHNWTILMAWMVAKINLIHIISLRELLLDKSILKHVHPCLKWIRFIIVRYGLLIFHDSTGIELELSTQWVTILLSCERTELTKKHGPLVMKVDHFPSRVPHRLFHMFCMVHPTARKWVITPIISGLTRSLSHVNDWGYNPLTKWDEPPSRVYPLFSPGWLGKSIRKNCRQNAFLMAPRLVPRMWVRSECRCGKEGPCVVKGWERPSNSRMFDAVQTVKS